MCAQLPFSSLYIENKFVRPVPYLHRNRSNQKWICITGTTARRARLEYYLSVPWMPSDPANRTMIKNLMENKKTEKKCKLYTSLCETSVPYAIFGMFAFMWKYLKWNSRPLIQSTLWLFEYFVWAESTQNCYSIGYACIRPAAAPAPSVLCSTPLSRISPFQIRKIQSRKWHNVRRHTLHEHNHKCMNII